MADCRVVDPSPAVRPHPEGSVLLLDVAPGAAQARFPAGFQAWRKRIQIAVVEPAQDGRANDAVCRAVQAWCGQQVTLIRGATSRRKEVLVHAMDPATLVQRLEAAL